MEFEMETVYQALNATKTWVINSYTSDFTYRVAPLPLANWTAIFAAIAIYMFTIFTLTEWMKDRQAFKLTGFVFLHNAFLCGLSLLMLLGISYELINIFQSTKEDKIDLFMCDENRRLAKGPQVLWFYLFFLSKFYELLDTVIIVLKKRPVIFLHVYHHCITVVLTFVMLESEVAVQWLAITANVMVHVPMYFYYAMACLGYQPWWKKFITTFQITQFIADIAGNSWGFYHKFQRDCSGSLPAWFFGQAVLLSFLVLFVKFFRSTYTKRPVVSDKAANGNAKVANKKRD